jgi:hypothetical protein
MQYNDLYYKSDQHVLLSPKKRRNQLNLVIYDVLYIIE